MSGTHAHTVAYVADTQYPAAPPPVSTSGPIGWMRENLFSSWVNGALTIASLAFIVWLVPSILEWALFNSVWNAGSLSECREIIANTVGAGESGACWAVIHERFGQLMYGFYPIDYRWRPNLALLLLFVAMAPVLFQTMRPLARGLIACANLLPRARSLYLWRGEVRDEPEVAMLLKTRQDRLEELIAAVDELHPYDVPCVVAWPIDAGSEAYLAWVRDACAP